MQVADERQAAQLTRPRAIRELAGGVDLRGCPDGPFRLCLSHTPDNARWACRNGMDLVLSGHVHAML